MSTTGLDAPTRRAKPLSVEDRRAMLVDATIPLLLERGDAVTTKQIAEAAGVAEGTIFRAFDDKESLIRAAVEHHLDPGPLRQALRRIEPDAALEDKTHRVITLLRERFSGVFRLMGMLAQADRPSPPPRSTTHAEYAEIVAAVLQPDLERLNCPPERVAPFIRLVAFSSTLPAFAEGSPFTEDELNDLVLYGIAGRRADESKSKTKSN